MTSTISLARRLSALNLPGITLENESITSGSVVDLSSSEACEVTLVLIDSRGRICDSGRVDRGRPFTWAGLPFLVIEVEHYAQDGVRMTTVKGATAGWERLRQRKGARTWTGMSPTQVVTAEAKAVGLQVVAEPTAQRKSITRTTEKGKAASKVTTLDMVERLAQESGFVYGVVGSTLFFGRPSWLVTRPGRAVAAGDEYLMDFPHCTVTATDPDAPGRVTLSVLGDQPSEKLLPFTPVQLSGVPSMFEGRYLIDKVTIPLDTAAPGTVELVTPVDPEKQKTAAVKAKGKTSSSSKSSKPSKAQEAEWSSWP